MPPATESSLVNTVIRYRRAKEAGLHQATVYLQTRTRPDVALSPFARIRPTTWWTNSAI